MPPVSAELLSVFLKIAISQERYQKMLEDYEAEQASLNNEIIGLDD